MEQRLSSKVVVEEERMLYSSRPSGININKDNDETIAAIVFRSVETGANLYIVVYAISSEQLHQLHVYYIFESFSASAVDVRAEVDQYSQVQRGITNVAVACSINGKRIFLLDGGA
jgi:hypothetical protein